jgi:hypothetical protein
MTKEKLKTWLISRGYKQDTYRHFQKTDDKGKTFRYKIQDISVRYEVQITLTDSYSGKDKHEWVRIAGAYLKGLSINDKNQIVGLKR